MRLLFMIAGFALAWMMFRLWMRRGRVRPREARELVRAGALLVDVRSPQEFAQGHIEGAQNMPLQRLSQDLEASAARGRPIVVYCRSGMRSRLAAQRLRQAGFAQVHDLGPASAWPG